MSKPLIYVASPLSDMPLNYLYWLGAMNTTALKLYDMGWAPLIPGNDLLFCYRAERPIMMEELLDIDMSYIEACSALYVVAYNHFNGKPSEGVTKELAHATACHIPVVSSLKEAWRFLRKISKEDFDDRYYGDIEGSF